MSNIRKEFDEDFEKVVDNFISTDYDRDDQACGEIVDKEGLALWAAKWMAERCANELYGQKIADGSDPGETIRQLSKELE